MSRIEKEQGANKIFLKIVEGSLRQKVSEGHPEAVLRKWQAGGESGEIWEVPSKAAYGKITNVSFYEGEADGRKFTTLNIELDENEDGKIPVITCGVSTKYAQHILSKLPNIRPDEEVRIRPYSYLKEGNDKNTTGVEITRRDGQDQFTLKVNDFFYDWDKREVKNGYPEVPKAKEDMTSKDWRRYFEDANDYVIDYIKTKVIPKFEKESAKAQSKGVDAEEVQDLDEVFPDDPELEAHVESSTKLDMTPPKSVKRTRSKEEIEEGINLDETPFN